MLTPKRLLVIAPHADDESLGCATLARRVVAAGGHVHFVLATLSDIKHADDRGAVSAGERRDEFRAAAALVGASFEILKYRDGIVFDNLFPTRGLVPLRSQLVGAIETEIKVYLPDLVAVPARSYHEDHCEVHAAAYAALRPTAYHAPSCVVEYETPYYEATPEELCFRPNVYVAMSPADLDRKREVCDVYRSQGLNRCRERRRIGELAARRGVESRASQYAEAFRVTRLIF